MTQRRIFAHRFDSVASSEPVTSSFTPNPIELRHVEPFPGAACCQPIELPSDKAAPLPAMGLNAAGPERSFIAELRTNPPQGLRYSVAAGEIGDVAAVLTNGGFNLVYAVRGTG
jgi:hypothetical protein